MNGQHLWYSLLVYTLARMCWTRRYKEIEMPKKTLSEDECHKKLNTAVDTLLECKMKTIRDDVSGIKHTLANVSANGNKGLENSLKDLYTKNNVMHADILEIRKTLVEVLAVTASSRAWKDVTRSFGNLVKSSFMCRILKNKTGKIAVLLLILLVVNSLTHPLGFNIDLESIFKFITGK